MGGASLKKAPFFMDILINGNSHTHKGTGSLDDLLKELEANPVAVAIMVNDRVIPKAERVAVTLKPGDRVEVLSFMGGG